MAETATASALDVAVIGGGVVGLAAAAALARSGRAVVVLERHAGVGREGTSRNSQVIHAGLYYPRGSWKARLCVEGRERLYARCAALGIPHRRLGKWVVACDDAELAPLEALRAQGEANGVSGLVVLEGAALAVEPAVRARAALLSPHSGIVDALSLCRSLVAELEAHGGAVALRTELLALAPRGDGFALDVRDADGALRRFVAAVVVNAAGLAADRVAAAAGIDVDARGLRQHFCKGDYFALAPGAPLRLSRLVYPLPSGPGLGVHATLDLGGRLRFGPDAEFVDTPRYDVDPAKARRFAEEARRYLPGLRPEWLAPDGAGVRPRLAGPGAAPRDFAVQEESASGLPGLVNLVGIESPGLTAALAIAERVVALLPG